MKITHQLSGRRFWVAVEHQKAYELSIAMDLQIELLTWFCSRNPINGALRSRLWKSVSIFIDHE